jgi:hypothetical protein
MKFKHAGWAAAAVAAAALSAPVLAQTQVQSGTGVGVSSASSIAVTPGTTAVIVTPGAAPAVPQAHVLPGSVMAQADSQTTVNGNTRTTTTTYWANVPPEAWREPGFQRWQSLR